MARSKKAGWAGLLVLGLTVAACGGSDDEDAAECVEPELSIQVETPSSEQAAAVAPSVAAGSSLTVRGTGFAAGCIPTDPEATNDATPLERIRLFLVQGSTRVSVAQVNAAADQDYGFEVVVGLPTTLAAGPAQVSAQASIEPDTAVLATAELVVTAG